MKNTRTSCGKKRLIPCTDNTKPLSQEELMAWWPFERLDPKRFPKQKKATEPGPLDDYEEAFL